MQVVLSRAALADLQSIQAYVLQGAPTAAIRIGMGLLDACRSLEDLPARGRYGLVPGTREVVFKAYVIVYEVGDDRIDVLRIRHHAQLR